MIISVRVVLKRTVAGDRRFDNLSGSHSQTMLVELLSVTKGELQKFFSNTERKHKCSKASSHIQSTNIKLIFTPGPRSPLSPVGPRGPGGP